MRAEPLLVAVFIVGGGLMYINTVLAPMPKPRQLAKNVTYLVSLLAFGLSLSGIAAMPASLPLTWQQLGIIFFALAIASPLLGLLENVARKGRVAYSRSRFWPHLVTNVLGSALATSSVVLARRYHLDFEGPGRVSNDVLLNVLLILSVVTVIYFIHTQQSQSVIASNKSNVSSSRQPLAGDALYQNSLARWHQLANAIHLVVMTFATLTSFMYSLDLAMRAAKRGTPLEFSWEAAALISLALIFLLSCGSPAVRQDRSVYLTFLTGMPAVLCVAVMWIGFFSDSPARNAFAVAATSVSYVAYVIFVVLELKSRGEKWERYYYVSLLFALVLIALLIGLYLS